MLDQVQVGAMVNCVDYPLGTVERVLREGQSGPATGMLVRHGSADHLLRIPARIVSEASPGLVRISLRLEDVEMASQVNGRQTAAGQIQEAGSTSEGPEIIDVLGDTPGELPTSPQTG